jgi:hypothetical protein
MVEVAEPGKYLVRIILPRNHAVAGGYKHQMEKITRTFEKNGQMTLEYEVELEIGKCVFIDVPIYALK